MKNTLSLIAIIFVFSAQANAQNELPSGKIEVVKDFEVRLTETRKIGIIPQPVPVDSTVRIYEYKLLAPSPSIEYLVPEIKPLAINAEKKPLYYPFYARAGYGSPNSFSGMLSYDHVQSDKFQWGGDLRHLSANNKKIPLQKFSDTRGRINASYQLKDHLQVDGYIDSHLENVYFYGADPIPDNPESLKRKFNRTDVYFKLGQAYAPETSFSYNAFFQYMTDKDDLGSRENALRMGGEVNTAMGKAGYPVGISIMADLSKLVHTDEQTLNNILFQPYFDFFAGRLKAHLGAIALLNKQQNEILPDVEFTFLLSASRLSLLAGWTGEVSKNNFHFLSAYNPYISTRLDSINNLINRRIYAGLKGASGTLAYEITGSYTKFTGMAFFLQDPDAEEQFLPVFDDGSYIGIEGSLSFELLKHVFLRAGVFQRFYSLDHEAKPWHRPSFGLNGQITYGGGSDKYHVSFIFNGENGLPYRTTGGTEDVLDPLLDINLHGDYYITKSIGAFFELNNLLGNNRERWVNYPSFGFNAKAGVLFRLP